jgi:hypothetical protein
LADAGSTVVVGSVNDGEALFASARVNNPAIARTMTTVIDSPIDNVSRCDLARWLLVEEDPARLTWCSSAGRSAR